MIAGARFDRERMAAAASDELIAATDLADLLVGAACRSARRTASSPGSCATRSTSGRPLSELAPTSSRASERSTRRCEVLAQRSWLESKVCEGGTALARVREQLDARPRRARWLTRR